MPLLRKPMIFYRNKNMITKVAKLIQASTVCQ